MLVIGQTADSISMMLDAIRTVSDRVSYCDDEPTLNVVVIRQLVAENNVSGNALKLQFNIFFDFRWINRLVFIHCGVVVIL